VVAAALLLGGAVAFEAAAAEPAAARPVAAPAAASWRHLALWDDGRAEYAAYAVDWARYGALFPGRALLVLVKEPWAPELDVKADRPRPDGFEVLKLNHLRDVRTGIYTYHQMASVFLRRDDGSLRKLAASSSEACGVATALVRGGELATGSYFDGQGDRTQPWPAGAIPEDALPAALRDLVAGAAPATLEVFPELMMGRFDALAPRRWTVRRATREVTVPAGRFAAVELRLERDRAWQRYAFAAEPPHPLLELERSDGTRYRLVKLERLAYWRLHDPGGEEWWPEALRDRSFALP
jgi:hypothetical protein